jgi:hypothetical protein
MTLKRTMLITIACVGLSISMANASPFVNPPETNPMIPAGGWQGAFPYQRNVMIDFATDPNGWPDDPVPGKKDLVPQLNYHLEGDDDPVLYPSDWFDWTGQLGWYDDSPIGTGRQGLIGFIDQEAFAFTVILHLDNWREENPYKHLYLEMDIYREGTGDWIGLLDAASPGVPGQIIADEQDLGDGWARVNAWVPIEPNPEWEELQIILHADEFETGSVLVDSIHIATECVPEPITASLLVLGGVLLVARRKR